MKDEGAKGVKGRRLNTTPTMRRSGKAGAPEALYGHTQGTTRPFTLGFKDTFRQYPQIPAGCDLESIDVHGVRIIGA